MAKITIGKCENCGRELKVKEDSAKSVMHLTCKCGWHGFVGGSAGDILKCKNCGEQIPSRIFKANRGLCSECAKGGTIARLRRIPQWQCPYCGTIFLKGSEFEKNKELFQAYHGMAAVSCAHCRHSLDGHALYGGTYDFREGSPSPVMKQYQQPLEQLSEPVEGVEESLIEEIIECLNAMDIVDHLPLSVSAKLSTQEWIKASTRLAEIGNHLNKEGGFQLMQKIYKCVHNKRGRGSYLDRAWNGIGEWQA